MVQLSRIGGLAFVGRVAFQPLTPMFHMLDLRSGQKAYVEQVARSLEACRRGLNGLMQEYAMTSATNESQTFVPYPLLDTTRLVTLLAASSTWISDRTSWQNT